MESAGALRHKRALPPHAGGPVLVYKDCAIDHVPSSSDTPASAKSGGTFYGPSSADQGSVVRSRSAACWLRVPLRECARNRVDDGAQARALLDAGAETEDTDVAGRTALHWAAARGNISVVHALLDAGANTRARDGAGSSPLHCAARAGYAAVVEALLEWGCLYPSRQGAAILDQPPTGSTSASVTDSSPAAARQNAHEESIADARNYYGSTALHRAAFNGREEVLKALLHGGAGVDMPGRSGRSALHLACRNVHPGCVEMLLAAGAFESLKSHDGSTPWSELASAAESRRSGDQTVERVAALLRRSHGRRAWGRRGWLVMLKAAQDCVRAESSGALLEKCLLPSTRSCGKSAPDHETDETGVARVPGVCGGITASDEMECVVEEQGWEGRREKDSSLSSVVSLLLNVGEEGTFRLVINFL